METITGLWKSTFDIAKDAVMLPIVLHQNNLRPMFEKWLHGEQARWWTHAQKHDILDQPVAFRGYIRMRYQVVATLASQAAISAASRRCGRRDNSQKSKEGQIKPPADLSRPPQKVSVNVVTQQSARGKPQWKPMPCRMGGRGVRRGTHHSKV